MAIVTDKDKEIYKHIEKMGFATVKQIGELFYNDITYRHQHSKKRLNALMEHGYIKGKKSTNCNQHVFYADKQFANQTYHNIVVLDFIVKLMAMRSVEVIDYEIRKCWSDGEKLNAVNSDAFVFINYQNSKNETVTQGIIVEAHTSNNSWQNTLGKYFNEGVLRDIQSSCEGAFPILVLLDDVYHNITNPEDTCPFQVIQIDTRLQDFPLLFASY